MADLVKKVNLKIVADDGDAQAKLDAIKAKADNLRADFPEFKLRIDKAEATAKLAVFREELKAATRKATVTIDEKVGKSGLLGRLLLGSNGSGGLFGSNGGKGFLSSLDNLPMGGLPALAAAVPVVGALLVELTGLVAGFSAATVGVGAFAAVALPAYEKLKTDIAAVHSANQSFQESAKNVDTAIRSSSLDAADYNKALAAMPRNLASATKLLGDQSVRWQDLSKRQQDNVTALANNKAALKSLLPSQKTALSALLSAKTAWDDMNPAQQKAARSLNQLSSSYQKIVTALQPTVFKVFNDGLKAANELLPHLQPLAQAGGTAIDGLLKQFGKFTSSKGFKDWLGQFSKLIGPSITAIGQGVGHVVVAFGKLLTVLSAKDVVNAINIAFRVLSGTIGGITYIVKHVASNFTEMVGGFREGWKNIKHWTDVGVGWVTSAFDTVKRIFTSDIPAWIATGIKWFNGLPGRILHAIGNLGGLLVNAGKSIISGLITGVQNAIPGLSGALHAITGLIPSWKGPMEKDKRLLYPNGLAIIDGLIGGIHGRTPQLAQQLARTTSVIQRGVGAPGGGRGRIVLEVRAGNNAAYSNFLAGEIKKYVQARGGGDVQVAYGRTA